MKKWVLLVAALGATCAPAQDADQLANLQFHGFATQAFLVSGHNNYLGMDTRHGSAGWTEAALNINDEVTDKLRVGIQLHYTRLGAFGDETADVDWALGDYKFNPWLGVRAGKVKIRWGLYNDTQDYDPGYVWSLLPEPVYGIDTRATNLSQLGGEVYGKVHVGGDRGEVTYSAYYGNYTFATNDGYMNDYKEEGVSFVNPPAGRTPGFDVRWNNPVPGVLVGGSVMMFDARADVSGGGTFRERTSFWPAYYAQYSYRKLFASGQFTRLVVYDIFANAGSPPKVDGGDSRAWFAMGGYHLTEALQAGAYYTRYLYPSGGNNADPANYIRDWVASGRYDINANFYLKLEGHFMHGNGVGFYDFDNPNGITRATNLAVMKLGFSF